MLTGKIAASSGHAAWISCEKSRDRVFELRGRSDAIIVGGNTVRRDSKFVLSWHVMMSLFKCYGCQLW